MSGTNINNLASQFRTSVSQFPGGFANGVTIRGMSVLNSYSGQVFWVDSVHGSDGNRGTYDRPYATLSFAVSQCQADRSDMIVIKSGHAETIATAGAVTIATAGINIVGLGTGSDRPQFTFSAAAASILITAANVSIQNVVGIAGAATTNPFHVQAADCYLDLEWHDVTATSAEAVRVVLTTAAADRLNVRVKHIGLSTSAVCVNSIRLVGVDTANVMVDFYGVASTAVVEFLTTACTNVLVSGKFHNIGTALTKNIIDTVTGSTWSATGCWDGVGAYSFSGGSGAALAADDISVVAGNVTTILADMAVPAPDSTANVLERDVIGNKSDAAVTTVGTTASIMAYIKGVLSWLLVPTADAATNTSTRDVVGNKTDAAITTGIIGTTNSIMAYIKGLFSFTEKQATSTTAVMVNGNTIFTATGDIQILSLVSECVTTNDATASTVQYQSAPTVGVAATFTGASASLANAAAGASLSVLGTSLATAPSLSASGANLGMTSALFCPAGTIKIVVGVGSTTGTWKHYIRYRPLEVGATVS